MSTENNHYPEFDYAASELSAYIFSVDFFIISLKSTKMIAFSPKDIDGFKNWLNKHEIRDIRVNDGIPEKVMGEVSQKTKRK
ncbi:MAG: hypothetical protein JNL72_08960 [Flavipsychrobacter sp.]|nr:hypothetical protein [Flavipsychrobacter sp.]